MSPEWLQVVALALALAVEEESVWVSPGPVEVPEQVQSGVLQKEQDSNNPKSSLDSERKGEM